MNKKVFLLPMLFFAALFWGCKRSDNSIKPSPKPVNTDFADTTSSNWEFLGVDNQATSTTFNNPQKNYYFLLGYNPNANSEVVMYFNKRPVANATYDIRSINSAQTDTTCSIAVGYTKPGSSTESDVLYSGNTGTVKVTVPNGKIRAYFSNVQVGGNDSTTHVSGFLIEQ